MTDHINMQTHKTGKIFGMIKQGATQGDQNLIKRLQKEAYNEHEIQRIIGVHFRVIRSFMKFYDPSFEISEAEPTPDTQHLHDRIKELEELQKAEKAIDEQQDEIVDESEEAHDLD